MGELYQAAQKVGLGVGCLVGFELLLCLCVALHYARVGMGWVGLPLLGGLYSACLAAYWFRTNYYHKLVVVVWSFILTFVPYTTLEVWLSMNGGQVDWRVFALPAALPVGILVTTLVVFSLVRFVKAFPRKARALHRKHGHKLLKWYWVSSREGTIANIRVAVMRRMSCMARVPYRMWFSDQLVADCVLCGAVGMPRSAFFHFDAQGECGHECCMACLRDWVESNDLLGLQCPLCKQGRSAGEATQPSRAYPSTPIVSRHLKKLYYSRPKQYNGHLDRQLREGLKVMPDVIACPNPMCGSAVFRDRPSKRPEENCRRTVNPGRRLRRVPWRQPDHDYEVGEWTAEGEDCMTCDACGFSYCVGCSLPWSTGLLRHAGESCARYNDQRSALGSVVHKV